MAFMIYLVLLSSKATHCFDILFIRASKCIPIGPPIPSSVSGELIGGLDIIKVRTEKSVPCKEFSFRTHFSKYSNESRV